MTAAPHADASDLTGKLYGALSRCVSDPARRPSDNPTPARPLTADMVDFLDFELDRLTAFRTYAAFVAAARTGYVPSIYADDRRRTQLGRMLLAAGWPVFDGNRTQYPTHNHPDSPYRA